VNVVYTLSARRTGFPNRYPIHRLNKTQSAEDIKQDYLDMVIPHSGKNPIGKEIWKLPMCEEKPKGQRVFSW
jgi:hypothetical protein